MDYETFLPESSFIGTPSYDQVSHVQEMDHNGISGLISDSDDDFAGRQPQKPRASEFHLCQHHECGRAAQFGFKTAVIPSLCSLHHFKGMVRMTAQPAICDTNPQNVPSKSTATRAAYRKQEWKLLQMAVPTETVWAKIKQDMTIDGLHMIKDRTHQTVWGKVQRMVHVCAGFRR